MSGAYDDLKVLDLTHVLAGPYATYLFALHGAEVIKIEPPGNLDCARGRGPHAALAQAGLGINYQTQATGKKSLLLDLQQEDGREVFRRLVKSADVLVENYRVGALEALGLGSAAMTAINPRLIYCSITGFGHGNSRSEVNAYDNVIQAASGMMCQTGTSSEPRKVGASVIDYATGLSAAFAISTALSQRKATGIGSVIDCAMFDTALTLMSPEAAALKSNIGEPKRLEAGLGTYQTASGRITLGLFTPKQNRTFWSAIGHDQFAALSDWKALWDQAEPMRAELARRLLERSAEEWESWFHDLGLPAERVRTLQEAVNLPHLADRSFWHEQHGVSLPLAPYGMSPGGPHVQLAPPRPGQHTRPILLDAGLSEERIDSLEAGGVIA